MKKYSFSEEIKKSGIEDKSYFKFKEGKNRFRIMSEFLPHRGEYNGKPTLKFVGYVLDRADKQIKTAFLPTTIIKGIEGLQMSEDFAFDGVPMPYDLEVIATNAGTIDVEYKVNPTKETVLTDEEITALFKLKPVDELKEKLESKNKTEEVDPDEISVDQIPL